MSSLPLGLMVCSLALTLATAVSAQPAPPTLVATPDATAARPLAASEAARAAPAVLAEPATSPVPEAQVLRQVSEDDQVRIEELRVRGQTRRLTVQPKIRGIGAYEIAVPEPGRDPVDDGKAGKRVWLSINF